MIANLIALFNHPVTKAIIDTSQYAFRVHIAPALNKSNAQPTQEEVNETANQYAMPNEDEINNAEVINFPPDIEAK